MYSSIPTRSTVLEDITINNCPDISISQIGETYVAVTITEILKGRVIKSSLGFSK
jgi:hypothetical protein